MKETESETTVVDPTQEELRHLRSMLRDVHKPKENLVLRAIGLVKLVFEYKTRAR
jgi:hypothetical protein